jgi:four helix bundle protein
MFMSFEDLEVWKRACNLAVHVYELLRKCPDYGLRNQMQRSAVSIASNIAEGSERSGKDFARFLTIARGSAAELRIQIYIAAKIGLIDLDEMTQVVKETKEISRMLTGLAGSVAKRRRHGPRPLSTEH